MRCMMNTDIHEAFDRLERQVAGLKTLVGVLLAALATSVALQMFLPSAHAQSGERVIRTRGIIIEDESGRERILIGAPIPAAANRVRTDDARVRKIWGPRYPNLEQYMGFYKDYRHSTNGIVILDENGFDRVAVGDPVPDPNIGKRIGPSTGFVINDEQGFERSGYGLLNVNGQKRVVLGLDSARGQEGLTLGLYDEGSVGLSMRDGKRLIYVGSTTAPLSGTGPFHGLLVRGTDGTTFVQNSNAPASK
ncbi:MAG: hypothetical protein ACRD3G_18790 [Vicinamibacterales bacterium]